MFQAQVRGEAAAPRRLASRVLEELISVGLVSSAEREKYRACVEEALKNAVEHGNDGRPDRPVFVRAFYDGGEWGILVEDDGEGFRPAEVSAAKGDARALADTGRGIRLMRHVMDRVEFFSGGRAVVLSQEVASIRPRPPEPDLGDDPALVRVERRGEGAVALVAPRLWDDPEVDLVFDDLARLATEPSTVRLVVDLQLVEYLNSHALGRLAALARRCGDAEVDLRVASPSDEIAELFATMRLDTVLAIHATSADALSAPAPER